MNKPRILIVEDEMVVALDVEGRLTALGYQVIAKVDTAAAAIDLAERERPDLVLMDVRLKGDRDGIDAAIELHERLGQPVVFLTAHADEQTIQRAKASEPFGYILKPFEDRELRTVIEMALYKQRSDAEIRRVNRLYSVLSHVSRALVGARSRPDFLEHVCRIAVEEAQFHLAWIGRYRELTGVIEAVASWGVNGQDACTLVAVPQATSVVSCPCAQAVHRTTPVVGSLPVRLAPLAQCCTAAVAAGMREIAAFPVAVDGRTWGVFSVYTDRAGILGHREIALLQEVAGSIGFALEHLEREDARRLAEEAVQAQKQLFETLLEVIPAPIFLKDPGGRLLRCNEAFAQLAGQPRQKLLQCAADEVSPPELARADRAADDALFRQGRGGKQCYEGEVVGPDGTRRTMVFHKAVCCNVGGVPTGIVGVMLDITELKERERALVRSEARYRLLFESVLDGVVVVAIEDGGQPGRFIAVNDAMGRLTGLGRDELLRLRATDLRTPSGQAFLAECLVRVRATGRDSFETEIRHREGHPVPVEIDARVFEFEGRPAVMALVRDVTERRQAEQEVLQRNAEVAAIYDNAPFMMCLVDRTGRIVRQNRALISAVAGGRRPEVGSAAPRGIACLEALDSEGDTCVCGLHADGCRIRAAVRAAFQGGGSQPPFEGTLALWGEASRPGELHVAVSTALVAVAEQSLVLLCMEDITRRRELEARFLHAQKMEAVGQLAGGIAHDFNNILAAMLMNLALLRSPGRREAETAEAMEELERLARRAEELTRQLLVFGRRQVPRMTRIDVDELIASLMRMLRRLLGEHIEIAHTRGPGPAWVEGDTGMIEQVVVNLAVNARDAMPRGGRLTVGLEVVEVAPSERAGGPYVRLRIADTGCGMEPETLARIFEPFFTTKEVGRGTGLGLASAHTIIEQHQGWIDVESVPGAGTTFLIYLPARERPLPPSAGTPPRVPASADGTETILLVEDSENLRRMAAMTLRSFGYEVIETGHGQEALEYWNRDPEAVDSVLTDQVMPGGMTGLELIQNLRRTRPGLRAVITSGYSLELTRPDRTPLEHVAYLPKPYEAEALARAIRQVLDP